MIEMLFLACNRAEFTKASLKALFANTNWGKVSKLLVYDDASENGAREYLGGLKYPISAELRFGSYGSPVAIMNDYLCRMSPHDRRIFAKIDNDVIVPPGWLDECLQVMSKHQELDLLGIEAFNLVVAQNGRNRSYSKARFIGGIGLMRSGAFVTLPRPNGRYGFTAWQEQSQKVVKGWIDPSLPVFLLDRLPREPWQSLSREYIARGWQRQWSLYEEKSRDLWSWWCE